MMTQSKPFEILVAEDNPADVNLVNLALKEHYVDCVLHVESDGAKAIQWIDTLEANPTGPQLDLLIVDLHLPKRDGEEILKRLRSTEKYSQTPVVVMTSVDANLLEEKTVDLTGLTYFQKPSRLADFMRLGAIVRGILGEQSGDPKAAAAPKIPGDA